MSSLIDVLKQIQNEYDFESRTDARAKFDQLSVEFEEAMETAFPTGFDAVKQLAAEKMMMAEYWQNQWVGTKPEWHGDWGKALRQAVREIKADAQTGAGEETLNEMSWHGSARPLERDEEAYAANVAAQQRETETAPGEETVQHGTVQVGKNKFDAVRSLLDQSITYRTKSGERKIFPGQRVYSTWSQNI